MICLNIINLKLKEFNPNLDLSPPLPTLEKRPQILLFNETDKEQMKKKKKKKI